MQSFSTLSSHKKLYRIQSVQFLITEHIFGKNKFRPEFLKIEFLKGETLLYTLDIVCFSLEYHGEQKNIKAWYYYYYIKIELTFDRSVHDKLFHYSVGIENMACSTDDNDIWVLFLGQVLAAQSSQLVFANSVLPGVPKKTPDVWFDVSWKRLYLHDLLLYFLHPHTST